MSEFVSFLQTLFRRQNTIFDTLQALTLWHKDLWNFPLLTADHRNAISWQLTKNFGLFFRIVIWFDHIR